MKTSFIDLKDPDVFSEGIPHEAFARLRREAPVAWNPEVDSRGFWSVTRYDDIVAVSKNPKFFLRNASTAVIASLTKTRWALPASARTKPKHR